MQQFVPLTDDLLFEHPDQLPGPVVPFDLDYPCQRGLAPDAAAPREPRHED